MKKANYINLKLLNTLYLKKKKNIFDRNLPLLPFILGFSLRVHNGISLIKLRVSKKIIGHKLGEFCYTRASYYFKKKSKLKKLKK